jgi:hypothetical protein
MNKTELKAIKDYKALGVTVDKVAAGTNFSQNTVRKYLAGRHVNPSTQVILIKFVKNILRKNK